MRPREIDVRIEELILQEFWPADRLQIGAAVERELSRLFTERGLPAGFAGGAGREAVDAGSFIRAPLASPSTVGGQVARAVYQGLDQ